MSEEPLMEHPSGQYATALDAMEAAITQLRALREWNRWITFCAQGQGSSPESIHFVEIRLLSDTLETDAPLNLAEISSRTSVPVHALAIAGRTRYSIGAATPGEAAQVLDAVFKHLGIRPFPDEDNDHAVGAEW